MSRLLAARFALLIIVSFYAAGLALAVLYVFGVTPPLAWPRHWLLWRP